ncbi:MAG: helix-turn-helix domain-containing protein [Paracoccus sp. (in: a-proteobacteria)]|nr:helix-turn-helix domain-containing protein [Paracoccus sp. (in: a-proteobacteria)]
MTEAAKLRYDEGCLAAHALNLIGDRWALLVVRELVFAPKRFQMIRAGLPGITASVLSARLSQLVLAGVASHDARLGVYALTPLGQQLRGVLEALCRWALIAPGHDPRRFISPSALMISMGVNLQAARAAGITARAGFVIGTEAFETDLRDARLVTRAVARPDAPFVLQGSGNALAIAVYGPLPLAALLAGAPLPEGFDAGGLAVNGDQAAAQHFVDLFALDPQG